MNNAEERIIKRWTQILTDLHCTEIKVSIENWSVSCRSSDGVFLYYDDLLPKSVPSVAPYAVHVYNKEMDSEYIETDYHKV